MESIVLIMVICIYVSAVAAPLAVYALSRRTGHGVGWQIAIAVCAVIIWVTLTLGFLQEMMDVTLLEGVLEPAGFLALVAFATLSMMALILAVKAWPGTAENVRRDHDMRPLGKLAADIE
ncbi:MAG: hypothetical protein AAGF88_05255 [Pseudomonadota bacterium]